MRLPGEFGLSIAGKGRRKRSPEFPCVSRFRQRRLISFLVSHHFCRTSDVFLSETDVFMSMKHLLELVQAGLWDEAITYLSRFLPSDRPLGIHGRALFHFLRLHKAIAEILTGAPEARSVTAALDQCITEHPTKSPTLTRLRDIFSSLLCSKRSRAGLDLGRVRLQACMTVIDLVYETPELKDHMLPARGPMEPQSVLPIGFGYACFRPRRHMKKRGSRIPAPVVGRLYLQKKMLSSLTSSDHSQGLACESLIKAKEWLVDLVDKSLEAGKLSEEDLPQSACNKGDPDTPYWLTNLLEQRKMNTHTRWRRQAAVRHNEAGFLCRQYSAWQKNGWHILQERLEAWPDMKDDYLPQLMKNGLRFKPTMLDTFTIPVEDCGISSVTNAGAYEHWSQEYCSNSRKKPRVEPATLGQGFDPKRPTDNSDFAD